MKSQISVRILEIPKRGRIRGFEISSNKVEYEVLRDPQTQ